MSKARKARKSKNLLDPAQLKNGYYAFADGSKMSGYTWACSGIMPVVGNTIYSFTQKTPSRYYGIVWWDSNLKFISSVTSQASQQSPKITTTSPSSAAYAAVDIGGYPSTADVVHPDELEELMFCEGDPQTYEPYGTTIWKFCAVKRYTAGGEQNNSTGIFTYKGLTLEKNRADIKATGTSTDIISSTDQFFKDNFSVLLEAGKTYTIFGQNTVVDDSYIDVRYRDSDDIITTIGYCELPNAVTIAPNTDTYIYMGIGLSAGIRCSIGNFTANFYRQAGWHDTPVYVRQNGVWVVQT